MGLIAQHGAQITRGLSPALWHDMPLPEIFAEGPQNLDAGYGVFEDFTSVVTNTGDTKLILKSGGAEYFIDSGATVLQLGGNESSSETPGANGVLRLFTTTADNDECGIQLCGVGGEPFFVSDTAANAHELVFECRFRTDTITDSELTFFIGLAECAMMSVDTFLSTADPPIPGSLAHIGFLRNEDDPTDGIWAYGANSQTRQAKQSAFIVTTVGTALVADTWYKFGFRYDVARGVVTPYWDGTPYPTDDITAANIAAATFPDGEGLSPMVVLRAVATGGVSLDLDWIACAQGGPVT